MFYFLIWYYNIGLFAVCEIPLSYTFVIFTVFYVTVTLPKDSRNVDHECDTKCAESEPRAWDLGTLHLKNLPSKFFKNIRYCKSAEGRELDKNFSNAQESFSCALAQIFLREEILDILRSFTFFCQENPCHLSEKEN